MSTKKEKIIITMITIIITTIIININFAFATDGEEQSNTTSETEIQKSESSPTRELQKENNDYKGSTTYSDQNSNTRTSSQNTKTVTTSNKTQETASNNANLSNLGIQTYDFTGFKPTTTTYNTTVPNEVTTVKVYATTQSAGAKYEVSGNDNLKEGNNTVTIKVTAEDGKTSKEYQINVERKTAEKQDETEGLKLTSIEIDPESNLKLEPAFKPEVYEYTIKVKGNINTIPLKITPNKEDAIQKIDGNENLKDGENEILITISDKDEKETVVYKIKVLKNVEENKQIIEETKNNEENSLSKTIIIGVAIVVLVILIVLFIIAFKKNK